MNLPARLAIPALCLVVFTDLMGFGIMLPLLPHTADSFGGSGFAVGTLFASYSIAQLLSAPLLGRASDRFGRKPVLLVALSGSVVSALLMAHATDLTGLLIARTAAGACGGSIAVAHAFAVDLSPATRRTRSLGLLGASVGLGFVAGPAIGAALADQALAGAGTVSAYVATAALLLAALALPDPPGRRGSRPVRVPAAAPPSRVVARPLLVAAFCATSAFCAMEATLALLGADSHGIGPSTLGWLLAVTGVAMVLAQGVFAAPLAARLSDRRLAVTGAVLLGTGLGSLPLLPLPGAITSLMIAGAGQGLLTPALSSLVAHAAPGRTGEAMGAVQSAMALARATAPAAAGVLYDLEPVIPYLTAAALAAATAGCVGARRASLTPHPSAPRVREDLT